MAKTNVSPEQWTDAERRRLQDDLRTQAGIQAFNERQRSEASLLERLTEIKRLVDDLFTDLGGGTR